jgi:hypothetical protein
MFQGSVVPAYFDRSQATDPVWSQLEQAASRIPIVAVFDDQNILGSVYNQVVAAGVVVFGYVMSDQGRVQQDEIEANIDSWFARFPDLSGMFVDVGPPLDVDNPEQKEPAEILAYYQAVHDRIKSEQPVGRTAVAPTVMLNCGGLRDANFAAACLDVAVWEQDYATYQSDGWWQAATGGGGGWWTNAQASIGKLTAHVVQSVPQGGQAAMQKAISLAVQRGADYIYIYDSTSQSYGRLPTFWASEVSALAPLRGTGQAGGTLIVRPQSPAPAWQVQGAANGAAALARAVQQPKPVDASQYIWGGGTPGSVISRSQSARHQDRSTPRSRRRPGSTPTPDPPPRCSSRFSPLARRSVRPRWTRERASPGTRSCSPKQTSLLARCSCGSRSSVAATATSGPHICSSPQPAAGVAAPVTSG